MSQEHLAIAEAFRELCRALEGTKHAFIGALPVLVWGRVRTTTDLDIVVSVDSGAWSRLESRLTASGFARGEPLVPGDKSDALPDIARYWFGKGNAVAVDIFIAKTDFEAAVLASAKQTSLLGRETAVASPEASIVYKLLASRPHDLGDVESIFEGRRHAGTPLDWEFLDTWAREWEITDRLEPYRRKYLSP